MRHYRRIYLILTAALIASLLYGCYFTTPIETETTVPTTPISFPVSTPGEFSRTGDVAQTTQTTLSDGQIAADNLLKILSTTIRSGALPDFLKNMLPAFPSIENSFSLDAEVSGTLFITGANEEFASLLQDFAINVSAIGDLSALKATLGFEFNGNEAFDVEVLSDAKDVYLTLKNIYPKTIVLVPADYGVEIEKENTENIGYADGIRSLTGIIFMQELVELIRNAVADSLEVIEPYELETSQEAALFTIIIPRDVVIRIIRHLGEQLLSDSEALAELDREYENMVFSISEDEGARKPSEIMTEIADVLANADESVVTGDALIEAETSGSEFKQIHVMLELFQNAFEFSLFENGEHDGVESYVYLTGTIPSLGSFVFYFGSAKSESYSMIYTLNVEFYDAEGGATLLQLLISTDERDSITETEVGLMAYLGGKSVSCNIELVWKPSEDGQRISIVLNLNNLLVTNDLEETLASGNVELTLDYGENGEFELILPTENVISYSDFISDNNALTQFFEGILDNEHLYTIAKLLWGE